MGVIFVTAAKLKMALTKNPFSGILQEVFKNVSRRLILTKGLIYSWFEVGVPILGTPNLDDQIQERQEKKT